MGVDATDVVDAAVAVDSVDSVDSVDCCFSEMSSADSGAGATALI